MLDFYLCLKCKTAYLASEIVQMIKDQNDENCKCENCKASASTFYVIYKENFHETGAITRNNFI